MDSSINKLFMKALLSILLLYVTYTYINYINEHRYDDFNDRIVKVNDISEFVIEILDNEEYMPNIKFGGSSFDILINEEKSIEMFSMISVTDKGAYQIKYEYQKKVSVKKLEKKLDNYSSTYDLIMFQEFLADCIMQLKLTERIIENQYIRFRTTVKLTEDFKYVSEDNFDKESYTIYKDDRILFSVVDGKIIKAGAVKFIVNIKTGIIETEDRIAAIYAYFD